VTARLSVEPLKDDVAKDAVLTLTDIRRGGVTHVVASRDHAKNEEVLDIYAVDLTRNDGSALEEAAVDLAGYYLGAQIKMQRGLIDLRVTSEDAKAVWEEELAGRALTALTAPASGPVLTVAPLTSPMKKAAKVVAMY